MKDFVEFSGEMVEESLANWGHNPGYLEEIVATLCSDTNNTSAVEAKVEKDYQNEYIIEYELTLTEQGKEVYYNWIKENDYSCGLVGGNKLIFHDEHEDSIKNTIDDWDVWNQVKDLESDL